MTLAFIGFLDNREKADLVWLAIIAWLLLRNKDIRSAFGEVPKTLLHPKLGIPILVAVAYVSGMVWGLSELDVWKTSFTKETVLWFLLTAPVLFDGITKVSKNPGYLRQMIRKNISVLLLLEFLINVRVFPFWIEFLLFPLILSLTLLIAVSETDKAFALVGRIFSTMLAVIGLCLLAWAAYGLVTDFSGTLEGQGADEIYLPPLLTLLFLPYIYLVAVWAAYDELFIMLPFWIKDKPALLKFTKRALIGTCGFNTRMVSRFVGPYRAKLGEAETANDVRDLMRQLKSGEQPDLGWRLPDPHSTA